MTECVVHQYDPATGFINAVLHGYFFASSSVTALPNQVFASQHIPTVLTLNNADGSTSTFNAALQAAWSFVLDGAGKPSVDDNGNYLVKPPPIDIPEMDANTHVFVSGVKKGDISIAEVSPALINRTNIMLINAGLPILPGTKTPVMPSATAVSTSAAFVIPPPSDAAPVPGVTLQDLADKVSALTDQVATVSTQVSAVAASTAGSVTAATG